MGGVRPGTLPGTLASSEGGAQPAVITVIRFTAGDVRERTTPDVQEALALCERTGITWVNVDGLDADVLRRLGERFGLHPLALEDALNVSHRPKAERYDDSYFVVLRMMRCTPEIEDEQVSIFFGGDWVVTIQERPGGDVFDPVRNAIRQDRGHVRAAGADYLAYLLIDAVVDGYFPVIEAVGEAIEALQDEAIARPRPATVWQIQRLRRDLITLRRAAWPVREEIGALQRDETGLISKETRVFLRDAHDHAVQALDIIESMRETMTSLMEVYLSVQNQRLNEVMKVLTVIATVFIPLTFIASIYGMNFQHMPELHWRLGYPWALALMAVTAGGMILYFRRKGWW
jgi:magnesium transporter